MNAISMSSAHILSSRERVRRYAGRALARLRVQEALNSASIVLTISFWSLVLFILADRMFSLKHLGISIWVIWGCLTALGLPYVLWRTFSPRMHENLAAVLADDRLGLNSRLCSALTLDFEDPANSAFSEAFFGEAMARLNGLQVETAFPVKVPRGIPLLLLPGLAAMCLDQFMPYQDRLGLIARHEARRKAEAVRERTAKALEVKLEDLKKKVTENADDQTGQYKVSQLIEKAETVAKELKDGKRDAEEALVALGQLKREIQDEKERLSRGKEFMDRLEKLNAKDLNLEESDMTKEISEALKAGDPGQAARELRKLAQKIKDDILNNENKTDEQKKQELDKLKREVEKLAGALAEDEMLKNNLQELSEKVMGAAEFESLQEEIKKQLQKQGKGAAKLGQDIEKEIQETAEELERLEEDNDTDLTEDEKEEMEELEEVEESIDEAMENLAEEGCEGCEGEQGKQGQGGEKQPGAKAGKAGKAGKSGKSGSKKKGAQGKMAGQSGKQGKQGGSKPGEGEEGKNQGKPGIGMGGGPGEGLRPYRDGDVEFKQEKIKGKMQSGAITGISHFRGQGAKGEAPVEFVNAMTAAEQDATSSLELERIPVDAREVVKEYFLKVKEGAHMQSPRPAPPPATFDGTKPDPAPKAPKPEALKE